MEYITLDGHFTRLFGHHFVLLNHCGHHTRVSIPHYFLCFLSTSIDDHRENLDKCLVLHEGFLVLIEENFKSLPKLSHIISVLKGGDTSVGKSSDKLGEGAIPRSRGESPLKK
jgi:hypothetical protein